MARRRLNINFLVLVLVVVGLMGVAAAAYVIYPQAFLRLKWLIRGTPAQNAAQAKELYEAGNYEKAAEKYYRAIRLKPAADAELMTALADCWAHLALNDPSKLNQAVAIWNQALSVDPKYVPALKRLLQHFSDLAEAGRDAQLWDSLRQAAERLLQADPNDREGRIALNRAVIQRWMVTGAEENPQQVDDAVAALLAISREEPFDADTLFYVMQAKVHRAMEKIRANDRAAADAIFQEVMKLLEDALAAHPDDPMMHYRAGQALRFLGFAERNVGQTVKYADRTRQELEKAAELIKNDHPFYLDVKLYLANYLAMGGETARAEKMYRDLLQEHPGEIRIYLMLADLLSRKPATRAEAADVLKKIPPGDPSKDYGVKALQRKQQEIQALANRIDISLDLLQAATDQSQHDSLLKEIEDLHAKLVSTPGVAETPVALQLQGRIELAKGELLQAVQTLNRALKLMPQPSGAADVEQYYKLMYILARAYIQTEQTGEAKPLLAQIVRDFEKFTPARVLLVQLLLREGDFEGARTHVDVLEKEMPDSPLVAKLRLLSLDKEKDREQIIRIFNTLPEGTAEEVRDKWQIATYFGLTDEVVRLLENLRNKAPDNIQVIGVLARTYADMGDKAKALSLIDDAMARYPDQPALKLLQAQISGAEVGDLQRDMIEKIDDPFRKEALLYELAIREGNEQEAMKHLEAAAKLRPDDGRVLTMLFQHALRKRDWDAASGYLETLAKRNEDLAGGLFLRVQFALAKRELETAADLANQLTQKMPEFAQSWVTLAQVQMEQRKYREASANFAAALQKQPQNLDALRGLIECSYALDQPENALAYIRRARRMYATNPVLREMELQHELTYGDPEKVISPREEALQKNPDRPQNWLAMANTYLAAARRKQDPQSGKPLLQKAKETLTQAVAKWPEEITFVRMLADVALQLDSFADGEKAIQALIARPGWQGRPEATLLLADYYGRAGKTAEQENALRQYLQTWPRSVPVQVELSAVLAKQNKFDEAMKVLEANADDPAVLAQRIELLVAGGRLEEAEKQIQSLLAQTPNPSPALLNRQAYVYLRSGRPSEAIRVLDQVLARDPRNVEALVNRSTIYVSGRRNLDDAIRDLQIAREILPAELDVRMLLSEAYYYKGEQESAVRELEEAVRQHPTAKSALLRLIDLYARSTPPRWTQTERALREARNQKELASDADVWHAEAVMWMRRRDLAKAEQAIQQAIKLAPASAMLLRTYCDILLQSKQHRQLLSMTDGMVREKKAPWWVYQFRGRAKKALDDRQGALEEFSAAMDAASAAKDEESAAAIVRTIADEIGVGPAKARIITRAEKGENRWRVMMALLLQLEGDNAGAVEWIEKVLADPSLSAEELDSARRLASTLYLRLDPPETAKAVEVLRKLLEKNPDDPVSLNNLACTMIMPNSGYQPQDALQYSQRAYDLLERAGVSDPYVLDTQGYILTLVGRLDEGILLLRKAIDKKPIPDAYYHLGEAYLAMQPPALADAEEALKQALALLEAASRDEQPVDSTLKTKIEQALQRIGSPTTQP